MQCIRFKVFIPLKISMRCFRFCTFNGELSRAYKKVVPLYSLTQLKQEIGGAASYVKYRHSTVSGIDETLCCDLITIYLKHSFQSQLLLSSKLTFPSMKTLQFEYILIIFLKNDKWAH